MPLEGKGAGLAGIGFTQIQREGNKWKAYSQKHQKVEVSKELKTKVGASTCFLFNGEGGSRLRNNIITFQTATEVLAYAWYAIFSPLLGTFN